MIPPDYIKAAYIKAIAMQIERDLKELYIDGDTPAQKTIICEEVFYADREVTQEALLEFLSMLRTIGMKAEKRMMKYQLKKRGDSTIKVNLPAGDKDDE
jgi:hypothetical protein